MNASAISKHFGGVVLLNKPSGISSQHALTQLRRRFNLPKIGHAGTLDPLAQGLLICAVSEATKFLPYSVSGTKVYAVSAQLGLVSETEDRLAAQLSVQTPPDQVESIGFEALNRCLKEFEGSQLQIPPIYSALKYKGRSLYSYARQGLSLPERAARAIRIDSLHRLKLEPEGRFHFEVQCSAGTYVRSLVRDIGARLGCGALLMELTRLSSEPFSLKAAYTLEALLSLNEEQFFSQALHPIEVLCSGLPKCLLSSAQIEELSLGRALEWPEALNESGCIPLESDATQRRVALFEEGWNFFCGVGYLDSVAQKLCPLRLVSKIAERKKAMCDSF